MAFEDAGHRHLGVISEETWVWVPMVFCSPVLLGFEVQVDSRHVLHWRFTVAADLCSLHRSARIALFFLANLEDFVPRPARFVHVQQYDAFRVERKIQVIRWR